jgi:hypothetical protein
MDKLMDAVQKAKENVRTTWDAERAAWMALSRKEITGDEYHRIKATAEAATKALTQAERAAKAAAQAPKTTPRPVAIPVVRVEPSYPFAANLPGCAEVAKVYWRLVEAQKTVTYDDPPEYTGEGGDDAALQNHYARLGQATQALTTLRQQWDDLSARYPAAALWCRADTQDRGAHWSDNTGAGAAGRRAKAILESGGTVEEAKAVLAETRSDMGGW